MIVLLTIIAVILATIAIALIYGSDAAANLIHGLLNLLKIVFFGAIALVFIVIIWQAVPNYYWKHLGENLAALAALAVLSIPILLAEKYLNRKFPEKSSDWKLGVICSGFLAIAAIPIIFLILYAA
ncbi:MAG: hypothetical protein PHW76_08360 [Alphaproteobacteria bacterium]|nr:hypothetical protein [Alphaproteobacteria bacterium]